jgi:hypothetical protein
VAYEPNQIAKASKAPASKPTPGETIDVRWRRAAEGRVIGLRVNRWSWWVHWRELADYELPRRYKWLITPNQQSRGAPINQHILDSTGTLAARNLASGMMSGCTNPSRPWFRLKIGRIDSTQTSPISLWLAECERLLMLIFQESNFYTAIAVLYFDLVIFGTAVMLIFEDFENVIDCQNPCLGEFYLDNDGKNRPVVFAREFTQTVYAVVREFGYDNCSQAVRNLWETGQKDGANLTRELVVGHVIEPNDPPDFGIPAQFKYREIYWEWGGSGGLQGGSAYSNERILRKRGYFEAPHIAVRWDLVSNDAYGRSPGMDALPDIKQLQHETRRKAQGIDKQVNPPMLADMQLKNQPASLLPGGVTYLAGLSSSQKPGFSPVYTVAPDLRGMVEDLNEVRTRIKSIFFNDILMTASQYETRSNVTAVEWDMRKAESMVMLGPVLNRIENEGLKQIVERVFAMAVRARIMPPAPPEIQGKEIQIEFVNMLAQAQSAAKASGIERLLQLTGQIEGVAPEAIDNINVDYALESYSSMMNNDPKLIRSPDELAQIRAKRQEQQQQAQQAQLAEQYSKGAANMASADVGGGRNALQAMMGQQAA